MNHIGGTDLLGGSVEFLKYGPLGLAGLLLVLVVISLLARNLDDSRERLMRLFLYVGAFCFVVASAFAFLPQYVTASHMLHLRIEPIVMGQRPTLPAPIVTINNNVLKQPLSYPIASETTAIVDVSDAIAFVAVYRERDKRQVQILSDVAAMADASIAKLEQINKFALDIGCPGGAHGIPIPHGGDMAALSSTVKSSLATAKTAIQPIVQQSPPDPGKF